MNSLGIWFVVEFVVGYTDLVNIIVHPDHSGLVAVVCYILVIVYVKFARPSI